MKLAECFEIRQYKFSVIPNALCSILKNKTDWETADPRLHQHSPEQLGVTCRGEIGEITLSTMGFEPETLEHARCANPQSAPHLGSKAGVR